MSMSEQKTTTKDEEIEYLKKQLAEYEAVETYIMKMLKKKCDYEDVLKAHYREGKVVNGEWVDDDEDDDEEKKKVCEGCGDSLDICESSSHPCYKCDGGCGKVMGSNDNCIRICEDCK